MEYVALQKAGRQTLLLKLRIIIIIIIIVIIWEFWCANYNLDIGALAALHESDKTLKTESLKVYY